MGGCIHNEATLTLTDTTVSGCTAPDPVGRGGVGGGIFNQGVLTLTNSTVSGNSAEYQGGGIHNFFEATLTLTNSTVSGNSAGAGGGIRNDSLLTITSSTVSGNTAEESSAILNFERGRLTVASSVIDGDCGSDEGAQETSLGYNIESPGDTCGFDQTSDQPGVTEEQLNLGDLADNGGPTMTHALLTEPVVSIALDAIPQGDCEVDTDQRGVARPSGLESKCDIGSYEVQVPFACSEEGIRDAIAAGGGPHTFDCLYPWDWIGTEAEIVIDNDVILDGQGTVTITAGLQHRVFSVPDGVGAELRGLRVIRGLSEEGSGIWNQGTLTLVGVTIAENVAQYPGGGIRNEGTLTMSDSTVWGNVTLSPGGGLHNDNSGTMAIVNSTVSDNFGGEGADQISNQGQLSLVNSTLSGAAHNVCCAAADLHPEGGSITISNTLIDGFCDDESAEAVESNGYNIESPGETCGFDHTDDQRGVTAEQLNLGPLAENGGPTMTHPLLTEPVVSVAIDAIRADDCELETDQRGEPRDSMCDVGAFEVQP
jgi:hypothetical protein